MNPPLPSLVVASATPALGATSAADYGIEAIIAIAALGVGWMLVRVANQRTRELRASEQRFRDLFENAVEGVYENPASGGFRSVNPAMARLLGYASTDELRRLSPAETAQLYVSPTRREEFLVALGTGDRVTHFESEVKRKDGSTIWVSENVRAIRDAQGRLQYVQGFVSDVTERRRAEAALRASEQRHRHLFEHSPVGIVEIDSRPTMARLAQLRTSGVTDLQAWLTANPAEASTLLGHFLIVGINRAALTLFGAKSMEEASANLGRILTPEAIMVRRSALIAVWEGRNLVEGEMRLTALDGTVRTVYQRWWVPLDGDQPLFERTQLAFIDLTGKQSAEAALAAERARLAVTLGAMTESVITTDSAGVVQFMNGAAGLLTGHLPELAIGRPIDEICRLTDERRQPTRLAPLVLTLRKGTPVDLPSRTELQVHGGGVRRVEGRCAPMHDPAGRGLGAVLVLRDVTEKARFELEMLRASKLQAVGLLAGGIAHDFNNLLAIISGNLTLGLLDEKTAAAGGRWLREAERGTARAKELTQQLLTFAKGGEPVRSSVRLAELIREAAEFALHGSNVRCEFDLAPDVRPADADKGQIGQVVQNLVINGMQAMPDGGVIRVKLCNEKLDTGTVPPLPAGDFLRLEITDGGAGIAPEHLARVFEPFFTTKEHGTGLGLATVYSVVQKHSGHVAVESAPGCGATFRIWLPAARTEPAASIASASPFAPVGGRLLFMDDEESIRDMTSALLERLGLEVVVTANGTEAVEAFQMARASGQPFDLVMFDLTVPGGKGGAAAMQEILKLDPGARGIVSSGYSSDPVMANYRAHGFRGSVPKPYRVSDLARTLREVMAEK